MSNGVPGITVMDSSKIGVSIGKVLPSGAVSGAALVEQLTTNESAAGFPVMLDENWFLRAITEQDNAAAGEVFEVQVLYALIPKC